MTAPHARHLEPDLDQPYPGAPFGVAFSRFWKKGLTFTGRASRSEYWKAYLATTGVFALLYVVSGIFTTAGATSYSQGMVNFGGLILIVAVLYGVITLIPALAAVVRRFHDTNRSGAMYFVVLIPFIGGLILLILLAQESNPAGARFDVRRVTPPAPTVHPATSAVAIPSAPVPPPLPPASSQSYPAFPPPPPAPTALAEPRPVPPPPVVAQDRSAYAPAVPPSPSLDRPLIADVPLSRPASPSTTAPAFAAASDELDSTRLSTPAGWAVSLPDGRRIPVGAALYFGRSPIAGPQHPHALLVPIDDAAKSMSKTHASMSLVNGVVEITDLHSTNGTKVSADGGPVVSLTPGAPHRLPSDGTVTFGDYSVVVRQH